MRIDYVYSSEILAHLGVDSIVYAGRVVEALQTAYPDAVISIARHDGGDDYGLSVEVDGRPATDVETQRVEAVVSSVISELVGMNEEVR